MLKEPTVLNSYPQTIGQCTCTETSWDDPQQQKLPNFFNKSVNPKLMSIKIMADTIIRRIPNLANIPAEKGPTKPVTP
jgi:polyphosphate kinase